MRVTALIVTHNRCRLLKQAVASVLLQTHPVFELIIVNDASSDGTDEYLESLDSVIVITNKSSLGGAQARNLGIAAASGDVIAFLDDDDQWHPEKIEKQIACAEESRADLVYTGTSVVDENDTVQGHCYHKQYLPPRLNICFLNYIGITSTVFIRRELLLDSGFSSQMPALQEYELFIRLLKDGATVAGVPLPLVRYLQVTNADTVSSGFAKNIMASKLILQKHGDGIYWLCHLCGLIRIFMQKFVRSKSFRRDFWKHLKHKK